MAGSVLAAIAGLGGAIGTTVAAGFGCRHLPDLVTLGRITHSPQVHSLSIDLPSLDEIVLTGWDLKDQNLSELATQYRICDDPVLAHAQPTLAALTPRKAFQLTSTSLGSWIAQEALFLRELARRMQVSVIVLINLCPTEPLSHQAINNAIPWHNLHALNSTEPGVTPSRIYFRLAIEAGAHFINFTPNVAETPLLSKLAEEKDLCYSGRDGKTGQTFLKTVLAPAFRDRNLRIDGWFSTNLLGNSDGQTLAFSDALATKRVSKSAGLAEILGYHPGGHPESGCHQVHIHYYPPRGDAKEAWDTIDFTGFLGREMQMKLNLLARDSILAAPMIIDLIVITACASQAGHTGHLAPLDYFYKSPIREPAEHGTSQQFALLLDFLSSLPPSRERNNQATKRRDSVRLIIPSPPPTTPLRRSMRSQQQLAILGGPPIHEANWPEWPAAPKGAIEALAKVLTSTRWTVSSQFTGEASVESTFAREFATFNNAAYCVPCCSGTAALTIALEALGVGHGDEVLVPGLTWVACATAVLRVGALPVLVDIDPVNLCMSPQAAERSRTSNTKAIILVHSYCSVADLNAFLSLAHEHHLYLIEDCSQAHGALYFEGRVGSFGHVATFSMQQSKVLTSGEGGAVITSNPWLFQRLEQLRADGRATVPQPRIGQFQLKPRGEVQGHNYCLSEFHAAILLCQLDRLAEQNQIRSKNAEYLNELLREANLCRPIYRSTNESQPTIYRYCLHLRKECFADIAIDLLANALAAELSLPIETLHIPLSRNVLYRPALSRRVSPEVHKLCDPSQFSLPRAIDAWKNCLSIPHQALLGSSKDMEEIVVALTKLKEGATKLRAAKHDGFRVGVEDHVDEL